MDVEIINPDSQCNTVISGIQPACNVDGITPNIIQWFLSTNDTCYNFSRANPSSEFEVWDVCKLKLFIVNILNRSGLRELPVLSFQRKNIIDSLTNYLHREDWQIK